MFEVANHRYRLLVSEVWYVVALPIQSVRTTANF
jgi:hypothetical protein